MKEKLTIFLPLFTGFYGTIFDPDREQYEDDDYELPENPNYRAGFIACSQVLVNGFEKLLKDDLEKLIPIISDIEYANLQSPRNYNFVNDQIEITAEVDVKALITHIKEECPKYAAEQIKKRFTSREGFISFFSNDIEEWFENLDNVVSLVERETMVSVLLDIAVKAEDLDQMSLLDVAEDLSGYSEAWNNAIWEPTEIK